MSRTEIRPAASAEPAQWLLRSDLDWSTLVRYGPPGFEAYVRIAFEAPQGPDDAVRTTLAILATCTGTPDHGFAAIWEGWGGEPMPTAPRVEIPHRPMLLFTGPVRALRDAPGLAWHGSSTGIAQEPHLVWPEDRAWCLACEVDEELEFTVGASAEASRLLAQGLPGAVRDVAYGEWAPTYRDEQ